MIRHEELEGPLPVSDADFTETIRLCNRVLRPQGPSSMAEEYPRVLSRENAAHMWVLRARGRIVSHAATYALTAHLDGDLRLQLGGISSVGTDPAFRHRGYASRLVDACVDDLRAQGCHFAVLWTEVKAFYERLGFASSGSELLYRLTPADLRGVKKRGEIAVFADDDLADVMALRTAEAPHVIRSRAEWLAYLRIPKSQVWVARRGGLCTAYVAVGKGEDFRNCAHEWAGDPDDLLALLAHATQRSIRRELILLAPDSASPLNAALQARGVPHILTELGMFRCLDPAATFAVVGPWLADRVGYPVQLSPSGQQWRLAIGETTVDPLSTDTLTALLLGPKRAHELLPAPAAVCRRLERALPLPLFLWGFDSV